MHDYVNKLLMGQLNLCVKLIKHYEKTLYSYYDDGYYKYLMKISLVIEIQYNLMQSFKLPFWNLSKIVDDYGHDAKLQWCLNGHRSHLVVNSSDAHVSQFWV